MYEEKKSCFASLEQYLHFSCFLKDQLKMFENEYSRQEDSYKQQIADLEEEKEQLQVSVYIIVVVCFQI